MSQTDTNTLTVPSLCLLPSRCDWRSHTNGTTPGTDKDMDQEQLAQTEPTH